MEKSIQFIFALLFTSVTFTFLALASSNIQLSNRNPQTKINEIQILQQYI